MVLGVAMLQMGLRERGRRNNGYKERKYAVEGASRAVCLRNAAPSVSGQNLDEVVRVNYSGIIFTHNIFRSIMEHKFLSLAEVETRR